MTEHDPGEVACHLCFRDQALRDWIKKEGSKRGACPWCGRRGFIVALTKLSEPFRDVASIYVEISDPRRFGRGESIDHFLDDDWSVFSEEIQSHDLVRDLTLAILYADLTGKERYDYPDYHHGLFRRAGSTLEENWDEKASAVLTGEILKPTKHEAESIERDIADDLPDLLEIAFEDMAKTIKAGSVFYRARIHKNRIQRQRFGRVDLAAPPPESATAGRANQKGEPVLYLASARSTALAEVRAWKGAAVAVARVTTKRSLLLVDLSRPRPVGSPFFVELLKWRCDLAALLYRLSEDTSRPVMPHEEEVLYRPTQLLALLIKSSGYDGFIYPSAMGSGFNIVVFTQDDVEIDCPEYVRVKSAAYFCEPLDTYDDLYA